MYLSDQTISQAGQNGLLFWILLPTLLSLTQGRRGNGECPLFCSAGCPSIFDLAIFPSTCLHLQVASLWRRGHAMIAALIVIASVPSSRLISFFSLRSFVSCP